MEEILAGVTLINTKEETVSMDSIKGKSFGFYFSAHWCPPCRGFTPTLAKFYNKVKDTAEGAGFEIIFVSYDREEEGFKSYFKTMPWLAIKFADLEECKDKLSEKYDIHGIPTLVVIDRASGEVKDNKGRGTVEANSGVTYPSEW